LCNSFFTTYCLGITKLQNTIFMYTQFTKYIAAIICICLSSTSYAAWKTDEEVAAEEAAKATAYADSVHHWGAWELDIEPAAGGVTPAATQPPSDRGARVAFRTNSFSAIAPTAPPPSITDTPVPTPPIYTPPPVAPPIPAAPTISAPPGATPPTMPSFPGATPPTTPSF
jgi:hypothetical protein